MPVHSFEKIARLKCRSCLKKNFATVRLEFLMLKVNECLCILCASKNSALKMYKLYSHHLRYHPSNRIVKNHIFSANFSSHKLKYKRNETKSKSKINKKIATTKAIDNNYNHNQEHTKYIDL